MGTVEAITVLTYIFFIVLLLATFVERLLEILVAVFNYIEWRTSLKDWWNHLAASYQKRFEGLYGIQGPRPTSFQKYLDWVFWKIVSEPVYPGGRRIISAQLIRLNYVRTATRILGFLISFLLVLTLRIDLIHYLITLFQQTLPNIQLIYSILGLKWLHYLLTAVAISIGTEPLHHLIVRIERIQKKPA